MKASKDTLTDYKILNYDSLLIPFKEDISLRMSKYLATKKILLGKMRKFKSFANGHLFYGFHKTSNGWIYREWAPKADALYLFGDFNDWNTESHPLIKKGNNCWEIYLPGTDTLRHLSFVKVRVKAKGIIRDRIPLYIRRTVQDSITLEFKGQIWNPVKKFKWTDDDFKINQEQKLFIYEAHIGMAQEEERIGSFKEFISNILPRIKKSGYNTIQLMGIMDHPYYASFGYHVANFFSVSSWFGTPDDLKELIDTAHKMGIIVLMDLVHSHAVKNITEGINEFDGTNEQFFHSEERGYHTAWDSKLFNYGKHEVIHFLLSNIKFWMEEYHFDGFRFDGVTSMIYHNHGLGENFDNYKKYFSLNTDIEAINYLQFANELIKEIRPDAITIAEDMSGMPGMCIPIKDGGIGFDYRLSMGVPDLWLKLISSYKDEDWSMWHIWHELTTRRPNEKNIAYVESHDQALVGSKTLIFWLADKYIYTHMSKNDKNIEIERAIALHKLIKFITITLAGEGYLNFIGNEFGHPEWIDFPREGNNWSFKYARRQWSLVDNSDLKYDFINNFDMEILKFVRSHSLFNTELLENLWTDEKNKILAFKKNELIFLFNFNPNASFADFQLPIGEYGEYKTIFSSDDDTFGGQSRIAKNITYFSKKFESKDNKFGICIYIPNRTVLVLKKQ